ncbi:HlyD family secretion protein [Paludibacterium paludis]|uniref:Hemolysin D n=1 Tax=Paludibacterium paludis TaxID=1225769 RepID=A0A918UBD2_9NEIS|nr:HlyD family efflux transporter periplasmic adaptor subunit [Paludibacterium paludis]GGY21489.1 hemolysin D [Paludibacterium paludis]
MPDASILPPHAAPDSRLSEGRKRKTAFLALGGVVALGAIGYGGWWILYASHHVSTDNAYVAAETAQVTSAVSGIVAEVNAVDTRPVKAGELLVKLDDTDARLAVAQADAELGRARRRVAGYLATNENLAAQLAARDADLARSRAELERRQALAGSGGVTGEEVGNARSAWLAARAAREAAAASLKANQALTRDADIEQNPEVALARARLEQARVDLSRTDIRAPLSGVVGKRQVQIGQRVQAGSPLMSVVPVGAVHVDANFKEVQLESVRIGQKVELVSDIYGKSVVYHGKVAGFSAGSGAAFSMIPAQNATGNWIKVVQRLPVRVELDPAELAAHPLKVGLSMTATIDTRTGSRS